MATQAELNMLLQSPTIPPPPGVTPNLVNPPVHWFGEWVLTASVCLTVTTALIVMRLYTRLCLSRNCLWEDYLSFVAWVVYVPYLLIDITGFKRGAGVHLWNLSLGDFSHWQQLVFAKEVVNAPMVYITKLSLLLQIEHIFAPIHSGVAYWSIQAMIWLNTLYYSACVLATLFMCRPVRKAWQPWLPGHCISVNALISTSSLINVISDLLIFVIPVFCVSRLQMPMTRKLAVAAVFAMGVFTCVTSIMRTTASFKLPDQIDLSYEILPLVFWTNAEIAGGITCGCMPVMPQFYRHFGPKIKSAFSSYRQSNKHQFPSTKGSSIPPKRGKAPDPYDDSCNLTNNLELDSMPTLPIQVDVMDATPSTREFSRDDRDHASRDLESAIRR